MSYTIGACGFSATGSSAVTDLLREFDENVVLDDMEFSLPYIADGLLDLKYHLHEGGMRDYSCKVAIKRFKDFCTGFNGRQYRRLTNGRFSDLSLQYINSLVQAEWVGLCSQLDSRRAIVTRLFKKHGILRLINRYEQKVKHELNVYPMLKLSMSIYPDDFDNKTKDYVMSILDAMGRQSDKNVVLDQPFSGNNPQAAFPFFENPKAIVVDRDPRDYYLFFIKVLYPNGFRAVPVNNVENFVTFYRKERENMPYKNGNPDILLVQFEDMIYRYDETAKRICDFCGLKPENRKRRIFVPEMSIKNTQLYKKFPEYEDDIKYIEKELEEYLYPFESFGDIDTSGKMFFGRSPLSRK